MTEAEAEAEAFGIPPDERFDYFREECTIGGESSRTETSLSGWRHYVAETLPDGSLNEYLEDWEPPKVN